MRILLASLALACVAHADLPNVVFILVDDWKESRELSGEYPEKADELEALLDQRLKELNSQMPKVNPDYDPDARPERGGGRSR